MEIKINHVIYPIHFGIAFQREIDKRYDREIESQGGISFGLGLIYLMPKVGLGDPVALCDCIQAGTITLQQKPSLFDIENFLYADETNLEELGQNFMKAFNDSKAITKTLENLNKIGEKMFGGPQKAKPTPKAAEKKTSKKAADKPTED